MVGSEGCSIRSEKGADNENLSVETMIGSEGCSIRSEKGVDDEITLKNFSSFGNCGFSIEYEKVDNCSQFNGIFKLKGHILGGSPGNSSCKYLCTQCKVDFNHKILFDIHVKQCIPAGNVVYPRE